MTEQDSVVQPHLRARVERSVEDQIAHEAETRREIGEMVAKHQFLDEPMSPIEFQHWLRGTPKARLFTEEQFFDIINTNPAAVVWGYAILSPEGQAVLADPTGINRKNRARQKNNEARLLAAMEDGYWVEDHPYMIAVSSEGLLMNGQHTLSAASRTNRWLMISFVTGMAPHVQFVFDLAKSRLAKDYLSMGDYPELNGIKAPWAQSVTKRTLLGSLNMNLQPIIVTGFAVTIAPALHFVTDAIKNVGGVYAEWDVPKVRRDLLLGNANFCAAVARAFYDPTIDNERLQEFVWACLTGFTPNPDEDSAAVAAMNWMMNEGRKGGGTQLAETYRKISQCIRKHNDRDQYRRAHDPRREVFVMPNDTVLMEAIPDSVEEKDVLVRLFPRLSHLAQTYAPRKGRSRIVTSKQKADTATQSDLIDTSILFKPNGK